MYVLLIDDVESQERPHQRHILQSIVVFGMDHSIFGRSFLDIQT
jgi:hypothetical protein